MNPRGIVAFAWILWISEPGQDWEIVADYIDTKRRLKRVVVGRC